MRFVLEMDCGNAAFDDGNRDHEIARILRDTARQLVIGDSMFPHWNLYDVNGNNVGQAEILEMSSAPDVFGALTDEFRAFCDREGLPVMSADELLCLLVSEERGTPEQRGWLTNFNARWEAAAQQQPTHIPAAAYRSALEALVNAIGTPRSQQLEERMRAARALLGTTPTPIRKGLRVRCLGVDRFPNFAVAVGKRGTVVRVSPEEIAVRMDEEIDGAEDWENCVEVTTNHATEYAKTVDAIFWSEFERIEK